MSNGTRLDPSRISQAVLALMSPADRARYAPVGVRAFAPAPVPTVDTDGNSVDAHAEERRIQGEIIGWLKANGYEPGYSRMDKKSSLPLGWPDIFFAAHSGRAVALEVKTATGRTSPEQDERIARMQATGWIVQIVRSLGFTQDSLRQVEARQ